MRLAIGYGLLVLSCIAWAVLVAVPFLPLSAEQKVAWGAALYVFGQVTWFGCLPFLGREFVDRLRGVWARIKRRFSSNQGGRG